MHIVGFDFFAHVVILVFQRQSGRTFAKFIVDFVHQMRHFFLATFESGAVVIADNIGKRCFFHRSVHRDKMIETFVTFGVFGRFVTRQHIGKLSGYTNGIQHFMLGITRMHIATLELNLSRSRVEVFKFQFTQIAAIHGVSPIGSKSFHVEMIGAFTDFFVGREAYANFSMLNFGMIDQIFHGRHNFCDTGFIVGTQKRLTVGADNILSHKLQNFRKLLGTENDIFFGIQHNILTVIILDNLGLHLATRHIGTGIHVRNKTNHRTRLIAIGRQSSHQITIAIERHFLQANALQLFGQNLRKSHLTGRTGHQIGFFVRLRVVLNVIQKTVYQLHIIFI